MKRISFVIWTVIVIVALMFLQDLMGMAFNDAKVVPDVFLAFAIAFAYTNKKLPIVAAMAVICGIVSETVWHIKVSQEVFIYIIGALTAFCLKKIFMRPNAFLPIAFVVFLFEKCLMYPAVYKVISFSDYFMNDVIFSAIYNLLCFIVFYIILNKKRRNTEYEPHV